MRLMLFTLLLAILLLDASAATVKQRNNKKPPPKTRAGEGEECAPCPAGTQPADSWDGVWGGAVEEPAPVSEDNGEDSGVWPVDAGTSPEDAAEPWPSDADGETSSDTGSSENGGSNWPSNSGSDSSSNNQGQSGGSATQPADCKCMSVLECGGALRVGDEVNEESEENVCPEEGDVCCPIGNTNEPPPPPSNGNQLNCGEARPSSPSITLSDTQSQFGELPWTVLLSYGPNSKASCAGTLVSSRAVVTAAFCVTQAGFNIGSLVVRAGEWDTLNQADEPLPHQERSVDQTFIHPDYKEGKVPHNIAIITVTEPFELADNVNPICLPKRYIDEVDSTHCVASGWGDDPQGNKNEILKKIGVGIVGRKQCTDALRSTQLGKYFVLDQSSICAGGEEGKDVCQGDGGGPLACPSATTGAMTLIGVTSWGVKCGVSGVPGVYSDVLNKIQWITDTLANIN